MKVLFRPENKNDAQTPGKNSPKYSTILYFRYSDQSAVKGLFKEQNEQESVEPGKL